MSAVVSHLPLLDDTLRGVWYLVDTVDTAGDVRGEGVWVRDCRVSGRLARREAGLWHGACTHLVVDLVQYSHCARHAAGQQEV